MPVDKHTITKVELWPIDVPINEPFVVATGSRIIAQNACVRITLKGGAHGYGEMAPFPEVGGQDRDSCLHIATKLAKDLLGQSATEYRRIGLLLHELALSDPAARCGLEVALLDAFCRELRIPLWGFWGGADVRARETDITIPITTIDRTMALARQRFDQGFHLFKVKVGADVDQDVRRIEALHQNYHDIAIIADANQGYTRDECLSFIRELRRLGANVILLEQPVRREDLENMAALRRDTGIAVAADESVRSLQDAQEVIRHQAADVINIKIMKSGLLDAIDIASFVRAAGLRLMIGGMVETRIAMGCSFAIALGLGRFEYLDLDTPLLLATDPVKGGYQYTGPLLHPWRKAGLGLEVERSKEIMIIE